MKSTKSLFAKNVFSFNVMYDTPNIYTVCLGMALKVISFL